MAWRGPPLLGGKTGKRNKGEEPQPSQEETEPFQEPQPSQVVPQPLQPPQEDEKEETDDDTSPLEPLPGQTQDDGDGDGEDDDDGDEEEEYDPDQQTWNDGSYYRRHGETTHGMAMMMTTVLRPVLVDRRRSSSL